MYDRFVINLRYTGEKTIMYIYGFNLNKIEYSLNNKEFYVKNAKLIHPNNNTYDDLNWIPTEVINNIEDLFEEIFR